MTNPTASRNLAPTPARSLPQSSVPSLAGSFVSAFVRHGSIALLVMAVMAGCTTLDPYTREEQTSNAAKGAAIGAAVGVATGLITGDDSRERKKRALILGGAGALAGGGVGYYMDQQELKLRQQRG